MLCKCSGKYIDIYFILKITFYVVLLSANGGILPAEQWRERQRGLGWQVCRLSENRIIPSEKCSQVTLYNSPTQFLMDNNTQEGKSCTLGRVF